MTAIILFLVGLLLWLTSMAFGDIYWVHQANLDQIAAVLSVLSAILMLMRKENRDSLAKIFRVKSLADFQTFVEEGGLMVLFLAVFYTSLVFAPLPKIYFTRTTAYQQFEQVIRSDARLRSEVGEIKAIGLGSFGHKPRRNPETLFAMVTIFGERQTLTVRADAIMVDGQWIVELDGDL